MNKVYEIIDFDLKGKKFSTYKERPDLESRIDPHRSSTPEFYVKGTNEKAFESRLWRYGIEIPKNGIPHIEKFLPYFADVTEDLPGSIMKIQKNLGLKPKTYKNCQLLTEKHGEYLQFFDHKTKEILRIATNSNYYTPIEK